MRRAAIPARLRFQRTDVNTTGTAIMRAYLVGFLTRPAVVAAGSVLILRGLTLASRFLLSVLLARMLSPEEMGQYGLVTAVLAFALLATGLEFYSHTWREMVPASPAKRAQIIGDQVALGLVAFLAISTVVGIAVFSGQFALRLAPWFLLILATEHFSLEATRILIITSQPIRAFIGVFLRGGIWVYALALLMLADPSARSLETVLIWWAFGGVLSIAFAAFSLRELPWRELRNKRPDWKRIAAGLRTARPFMLTAGAALTISYVDRFMIDGIVGRSALGIYTFYSTIAIGLLSLGASISQQFLPKIIAGYLSSVEAYRKIIRAFLWSMLGVAGGLIMLAGAIIVPLLIFLQLTEYAESVAVFYLMLPGVLCRVIADVPSYALYAARADRELLVANLGAAIISIGLNAVFIPRMGLYGAALSSCAASFLLLIGLTLLLRRRMRNYQVGLPRR